MFLKHEDFYKEAENFIKDLVYRKVVVPRHTKLNDKYVPEKLGGHGYYPPSKVSGYTAGLTPSPDGKTFTGDKIPNTWQYAFLEPFPNSLSDYWYSDDRPYEVWIEYGEVIEGGKPGTGQRYSTGTFAVSTSASPDPNSTYSLRTIRLQPHIEPFGGLVTEWIQNEHLPLKRIPFDTRICAYRLRFKEDNGYFVSLSWVNDSGIEFPTDLWFSIPFHINDPRVYVHFYINHGYHQSGQYLTPTYTRFL